MIIIHTALLVSAYRRVCIEGWNVNNNNNNNPFFFFFLVFFFLDGGARPILTAPRRGCRPFLMILRTDARSQRNSAHHSQQPNNNNKKLSCVGADNFGASLTKHRQLKKQQQQIKKRNFWYFFVCFVVRNEKLIRTAKQSNVDFSR